VLIPIFFKATGNCWNRCVVILTSPMTSVARPLSSSSNFTAVWMAAGLKIVRTPIPADRAPAVAMIGWHVARLLGCGLGAYSRRKQSNWRRRSKD